MHLLKLVLCILVGLILAHLTGIHNLQETSWYATAVAALLAIGLYASTYGIDLKEARQHLKIIVRAVTIGVVLKAAIIGGSLALLFHDPYFFILGVAVAQIDPLSVASLLKDNRMSKKAKTILASWASFDDPITVLLSLCMPLIVTHISSTSIEASANTPIGAGLTSYIGLLGLNILLAGGALAIWVAIHRYAKSKLSRHAVFVAVGVYALLVISFSLSVAYFLMLGIALIGLFLRPPKIAGTIEHAIVWALRTAAILLGILLINGIQIWKGLALGIVAYTAQIIVGFLLTRELPAKDRWHISFAQQNGITANILSLLFEPLHPGTVAIVAPAVIVINGLHGLANKVIDKRLAI